MLTPQGFMPQQISDPQDIIFTFEQKIIDSGNQLTQIEMP